MQDLLQRLQELREIVASGPVVMAKLDEMLKGVGTPAEALMILQNANFSVTRPAPRATSQNGRTQHFDFIGIRSANVGRSFV
jgi:hypothetical protein